MIGIEANSVIGDTVTPGGLLRLFIAVKRSRACSHLAVPDVQTLRISSQSHSHFHRDSRQQQLIPKVDDRVVL